jgi:nucleoid DNA-binding protein
MHSTPHRPKLTIDELNALIVRELKKEGAIRFAGLGIFRKRKLKARIGRNPATGEQIKIPARTRLRFTALKESVLGVSAPAAKKKPALLSLLQGGAADGSGPVRADLGDHQAAVRDRAGGQPQAAAGAAGGGVTEEPARCSHRLRGAQLGRPDALRRRRPAQDRQQ